QAPQDLSLMLESPNGTAYEFLSFAGGTTPVNNITVTFDDASVRVPSTGGLIGGTFGPTSYGTGSYPSPAPQVYSSAPPQGTATLSSEFISSNPNGTWQLFLANRLLGPAGSLGSWSLNFTMNPPNLSISCRHTGNFCQSESGAQYSVVVT